MSQYTRVTDRVAGSIAPAAGGARTAGTAQGIVLIAIPLFAMLGAILIAPLLATIQAAFHGVPHASVLVPLLLTAPSLFLALLSPVAGVLADWLGARRVLLWSLALYGAAGTAPMYLPTLSSIFCSRLLVGVAEAGLMTCATTLLSGYFSGDARQKWFAYQNVLLPWLAAVLIAATGLIGDVSWRLTFGIYALSLVALLFAAVFLFEPPHSASKVGGARLPPWRHCALITAIAVPGSIAFYVAPVEVAFLLKQQGASAPSTAANVTALGLVLGPLGALFSRKLTRAPVGSLIAVSMAAMGVGLALMAVGHFVIMIAVGLVIQQMGGGLMLVTGMTYVLSLAIPEDRGAYAGVWWFLYMAAQFITPLVMSGLLWLTGGRSSAVLAAGGLVASTCIWLLSAKPLRRPVVAPIT